MVKILREKTDLKMARTGGYRRSAVWRPCGITLHAALRNKSVVCSSSQVTISTVMKLHGSVKRGGIIVKTYKEHLLTQLILVSWYVAVSCILTITLWEISFKCKSCTQFMCLIITHFVTVTIMYYSNLHINYMVNVLDNCCCLDFTFAFMF